MTSRGMVVMCRKPVNLKNNENYCCTVATIDHIEFDGYELKATNHQNISWECILESDGFGMWVITHLQGQPNMF